MIQQGGWHFAGAKRFLPIVLVVNEAAFHLNDLKHATVCTKNTPSKLHLCCSKQSITETDGVDMHDWQQTIIRPDVF